jgi:nucleoside-diphosphate-sugar epimerase
MRIFLAGAAGVIGRQLAPLLVEAGHAVIGMTRSPERAAWLASVGVEPVALDVYDRDGLFRVVHDSRTELIMHQLTDLAGDDRTANARIRVEGTRNLVDAARAAGVERIVAQSLSSAYAPGIGPAVESEPLDVEAPEPRRTSVAGVQALESSVLELPGAVVLRYGTFYGPGTWYAPDGATAHRVMEGRLEATGAVTSFLQVTDAARAAVAAISWPRGIVNVVDDEPAPASEWLPLYAAALGAPPPRVVADATSAGGAQVARGASNAKLRKELGWQLTHPTWREGFRTALG